MAVSIADALGQIPLQVGVHHCQAGKLRVEENAPSLLPSPMVRCGVMLDAWTDLPAAQPLALLQASAGTPLLPDVPVLN